MRYVKILKKWHHIGGKIPKRDHEFSQLQLLNSHVEIMGIFMI